MTLAVPATLVFCVDVAVTVTEVIVLTKVQVNKPVEEIVPGARGPRDPRTEVAGAVHCRRALAGSTGGDRR